MAKRFTYGDQFTPDKINFIHVLELAAKHQPNRYALQDEIQMNYFANHGQDPSQADENSRKMAMNCILSLNAYGLIDVDSSGKAFEITTLTASLLTEKPDTQKVFERFAIHILSHLEGLTLCRLIENIRARGEKVTLEYIGEELNEIGYKIPPNSTYVSTMKSWLVTVGAMRDGGYFVNWEVVYDLLQMESDVIDDLYLLPSEQKYFLLSMVALDIIDFTPSNSVAKHTRSVYKIRLTTKNLVKDVLEPLQQLGLIATLKNSSGRGAKPHLVKLTEKGQNEVLKPIIANLVHLSELTSAEVNRQFEDVVSELYHKDRHIKGKALEIFAVWIIRLLGLRFSHWRYKDERGTGGGEVDVIAASDKIVYSRWQIQCKNTKKVDIDVIAKEVGMTFATQADIVMVVSTGSFTRQAVNYATQVTNNSRYYVILLEKEHIDRIVQDKTSIVDILNYQARRTFARKELGVSDLGDELVDLIQPETEEELEDYLRQDDSGQLPLF